MMYINSIAKHLKLNFLKKSFEFWLSFKKIQIYEPHVITQNRARIYMFGIPSAFSVWLLLKVTRLYGYVCFRGVKSLYVYGLALVPKYGLMVYPLIKPVCFPNQYIYI